MYRAITAKITRSVWRKIAEGDLEAAFKMADRNMTFEFVGDTPISARLTGSDRFRAWFEDALVKFPGLRFDVVDVLVGGWPWNTRVAVRLEISATLQDGTPYRNVGVQFLRLRWGRMVDDWVVEDTLALQRACERQGIAV